jgi:predicted acetyltransferase
MYNIRKLAAEQEFIDFTDIAANAYPGFKFQTKEEKKAFIENSMKIQSENPYVNFYGIFEDDNLLGGMRFHDFTMNLLSKKIRVGGVGLVAVHLLHKKEKIAKEIITEFINHYRGEGTSMVMLYPFRPDFYKKMGFGFGTSMNQYKVKPSNLPKGSSKSNIIFAKEEDTAKLLECYTRMYERTNGLVEKYEANISAMFKNPNLKVIAYKVNNKVEGYLSFEFKSGSGKSTMINDMVVNDFVFENTEALGEMMTFLNSQNDQIRYVVFNIQDEDFRFLLDDPRNDADNLFFPVYHECSIQGTGIMYRVIDIHKLFQELGEHNFNDESLKLKLTIRDSFIKDNEGSYIVNFDKGYAVVSDERGYDVEIFIDIADFSSLITCAVSFKSLYKYGRVNVTKEEYVEKINRIFSTASNPVCMTIF